MRIFSAIAKSVNGSVALISAAVTIAMLFVPGLRSWLSEHGLVGWVAMMLILIGALAVNAVSREQTVVAQQKVDDLKGEVTQLQGEMDSRRAEAQQKVDDLKGEVTQLQGEMDSRRFKKDLALIAENLGPIQLRSKFHEYLKCGADFNHLPTWFANDLRNARDRWSFDPRSVEPSDLSDAWSNVCSSGEELDRLVGAYLWLEDSGPGTPKNLDWMCIPREWDYKKRDTADDELDTARLDFVEALDALYAVIHRHS